ncbi:MAG: CDP-diacylglycerol--glycerol-3-phosphate 3-phosphatidyltransferase [Clostridia bacterium]|nr:CDP-diacylglycerol--glycerol-3-phosphate 3-phosphatidyltransferase [Clostridia bacterium]
MKNVPNILSAIRILLVPFFVFFYLAEFIPCGKLIALIIFIVASLTDMLDGKIARKYNLVSDLGKLLDPIADKVLVLSALLMVTFDGTVPAPFGMLALLIILTRDYVVDAVRQIGASKGTVISADIWGKMKTVVTMVALIMLILYAYLNVAFTISETVMYIIWIISVTAFAIAVLLTLLSGTNYLIKNRSLFSSKVQKNETTIQEKQETIEKVEENNEENN